MLGLHLCLHVRRPLRPPPCDSNVHNQSNAGKSECKGKGEGHRGPLQPCADNNLWRLGGHAWCWLWVGVGGMQIGHLKPIVCPVDLKTQPRRMHVHSIKWNCKRPPCCNGALGPGHGKCTHGHADGSTTPRKQGLVWGCTWRGDFGPRGEQGHGRCMGITITLFSPV